MADLTSEIETAGGKPRAASADGHSAESHPLPDLIAADRHLQGQTAAKKAGSALRLTRVKFGGTA